MGHYGNIRKTWLHQQGRGTGCIAAPKAKWFCYGCNKEHAASTTRFTTLDKRVMCQRQFLASLG